MTKAATILRSLVLACGVVVISSWWLRVDALLQIVPDAAPMQANTALCFALLAAGALWSRARTVCASLAVTVASLTLIQYGTGWDLGIDGLLADHYLTTRTPSPGRMAPNTGIGFVFVGLSLLTRHGASALLVSIAGALGLSSLVGYALGASGVYHWDEAVTGMAVHTGACFWALWLAAAMSEPKGGRHLHGTSFGVTMALSLGLTGALSDGLAWLLDTSSFPARSHCGEWSDGVLALFVASELATCAIYLVIASSLTVLSTQQTAKEFRKTGVLLSVLFALCGTGHALDAAMFAWPAYRLLAIWHLLTACASIYTGVVVLRYLPRLLSWWDGSELDRRIEEAKRKALDG